MQLVIGVHVRQMNNRLDCTSNHSRITGGCHGQILHTTDISTIMLAHSRGQLIGLFKEASKATNAYRGELLGLMAIHLILVSMNQVHKFICGNIQVVSNCLGALQRVTYLPPYRIPSHCKHSNILKNILVNCQDLTFSVHFSHIMVHQDNITAFNKLIRKMQLNCICNHLAKQRLNDGVIKPKRGSQLFPLKPIGIFMGAEKNIVGNRASPPIPRPLPASQDSISLGENIVV
jgi:hypothetical protein